MEQPRRHAVIVFGVIIGALAVAALIAVRSPSAVTSAPVSGDSTTSCFAWAEMGESQQRSAAGEMLTHARDKADGATDRPTDALVAEFDRQIDSACSAQGRQNLHDVAVGVYLRQRATFRP